VPSTLQLVPAVTELMVAELLYLEKQGASLPIEMLINSSGTTRQDGEIVSGTYRRSERLSLHGPFLAAAVRIRSPIVHWGFSTVVL
jgi:hypothetical protein